MALKTSLEWVEARVADGTVRVNRAKWDQRRRYLTEPMMQRLRQALNESSEKAAPTPTGLRLNEAAREAGVSAATIIRWADSEEVERGHGRTGWRYPRH